MAIIKTLIWIVQMIAAVSIVILVLLQHGKGAEAGATFGSGGGSGSLFGAGGSSNFLSRTTAIFAAIFFISTFTLVFFANSGRFNNVGVMTGLNGKTVAPDRVSSVKNASASGPASAPAQSGKNQIPN